MAKHNSYRAVIVDGLSIFYREAGPKDAPTILLLHGLPSSSRMFRPLLTRLAGQFHMVAPDYPGFGHSDAPTPKDFSYTFDNIAKVMEHCCALNFHAMLASHPFYCLRASTPRRKELSILGGPIYPDPAGR